MCGIFGISFNKKYNQSDFSILKKDINYKLPYYLEWDVLNTPDLMPTYLISCFALKPWPFGPNFKFLYKHKTYFLNYF